MPADPENPSPYAPPAGFWPKLLAGHWERSPATFAYPCQAPLLTSGEALAIYVGLADRFRAGRQADIDLYVESGLLKSGIGARLPGQEDASIEAYLARATDQLAGRRLSLVTNSVKGESPGIYRRVKAFTRELLTALGAGFGGLGADLFLSNTEQTSFGVHRDSASNFSYIVSGRKRMLVWPQEVFAGRTDLRCDGPTRNVFLDRLDIAAYRSQATILEGGPGEMLYWPASYWHVAESTGQPSLVFNIPIYLHAAEYRMAIEYYERKLREIAG